MKKLNKIQINEERVMKQGELLAIRGGYGYVYCYNNGTYCGSGLLGDCGMKDQACDILCFKNWDESICAGW